jgi:hypothetical protein
MNHNKTNFFKYRIDPIDENGKFDFDYYSRKDYSDKKRSIIKYLEEEGFFEVEGTYIFYNEKNESLPHIWWVKVG